MILNKKFKIW